MKCNRADSIDALSDVVGTFIIPVLAILGIMFNLASIVFLGHREVRLRRSLVHQFIFLNTFDRYNCNDTFQFSVGSVLQSHRKPCEHWL